jgi:hypothetical protein
VLLNNMMAFEKHFSWVHRAYMMAYVMWMEGLVRCPKDAAKLWWRGILVSNRRTTAELVALFWDLGVETISAQLPEGYGDMLDIVGCHRGRCLSCWCDGSMMHFFQLPRVAMSVVSAVALIFMPSMLQMVYTMQSYFKGG